ncbi:hypothetical protein [Phreatobacter sp.]|uniref:hypothetical protein n=1 Tax=Phreatobacter sp. TaxID=1966341 RepID=UPI0022C1B356|nr:hypothetical protein [Phreatobacter sp.]MCZ8314316.1 hypothetical protein [Phreatobacter sp.]
MTGKDSPQPADAGRGIVICAGGKRYFTCAWMLVSLLRHHGCRLPIELWHRGPGEIDRGMADLIATRGVDVRDLGELAGTALAATPEALRVAAIRASGFSQVMWMDADCAPLADPERLFDWPSYRDTGLLLFGDGTDLTADHPAWATLGLDPRSVAGVDAGLLLVDKTRRQDVLEAAPQVATALAAITRPGRRSPAALLLAAILADAPFGMADRPPFEVEYDLVHRDRDGEALVQHRLTAKWNFSGQDRETPSPETTAAARAAMAELVDRWSGAIFVPPGRGAAALACEAALAAKRRFLYQSADGTWRRLDLHPGGRIGEGRGDFEQHWAVVDQDGRLILQFYSDIRLTIAFTDLGDGTWRGASCGPPGFAARLAPENCPGLTVTVP